MEMAAGIIFMSQNGIISTIPARVVAAFHLCIAGLPKEMLINALQSVLWRRGRVEAKKCESDS
jgi:hypothetical protein